MNEEKRSQIMTRKKNEMEDRSARMGQVCLWYAPLGPPDESVIVTYAVLVAAWSTPRFLGEEIAQPNGKYDVHYALDKWQINGVDTNK